MRSVARRVADLEIFLVTPAVIVLAFPASLPIVFGGLALVWIAVLWLARFVGRRHWSVRTPVDLPVLLLLVLLPLNLYASANLQVSLRVVMRIAGELAMLYAVVNWAEGGTVGNGHSTRVRVLSVVFVGLGIIVSLLAVFATNFNSSKVLPLDVLTNRLPHLVVPFLNALGISSNLSGGLAAIFLPLALVLLVGKHDRVTRLVGLCGVLFLGAMVLVTQSRGAWIGVSAALVVMALLAERRALFLLPVLGAAFLVAFNLFGAERLFEFVNGGTALESGAERLEIWQRVIYMLQDFPFTGVGIGTFGQVANILYPFFALAPRAEIAHAHNLYLQAGVDQGVPGMIAMIGFLTALLVTGLVTVRRAQGTPLRALAIGLCGALVVFLTHGMFDMIAYTLKTSALIYALFGLLIATARCFQERIVTENNVRVDSAVPRKEHGRGEGLFGKLSCLLRGEGIQTILWWLLVSLLAIGVMDGTFAWGLGLIVPGGIAVGLQAALSFLRKPDWGPSRKV